MHIDLKDVGLPRQCLEVLARVYQHPNTNKHTKDFIRIELQRILGKEYDTKEFLMNPKYKP